MQVDWLTGRLIVDVRPKVSERQDLDRGARVVVSGLEWLVIDPKGPGTPALFEPAHVGGYTIDSREGAARTELPDVPEGAFVHYFFVIERNAFIHFCARDAAFEWTDDAPRPYPGNVQFAGDEIPDP